MRSKFFRNFVLLVAAIFSITRSSSQCTRIPPAAYACPIVSGTAIIADGVTNNHVHGSGAVFYYNGSGGTAKISMTNDGILAVCGSLTVTPTSTFNLSSGGTIQVESGGSLTINTNITLNNTGQIVNRGTLIINGNITLTNVNATIWNLSSPTDMFTIGAGKSINLNAGYFIDNAPFSTVTVPTFNLSGGFMCLGDNANVNVQTLTNSLTNSVLYSGTLYPACLNISNSAQIGGNTLTNSSSIDVSLASGFSYTSGSATNWGSATVLPNSTGCYIVLPLRITHLTAVEEGDKIAIKWNTIGNFTAGEVFKVERSGDGSNFYTMAVVIAKQNVSNYMTYDPGITVSRQFYRIKQSLQNGSIIYSPVVTVNTGFTQELIIFPNPVAWDNIVNIIMNSQNAGRIQLSLIDLSGKTIIKKNATLINGSNRLRLALNDAKPGTYILKIYSDNNSVVFSKILVVPM